jgi:hypothetical protein
LYDAADFEVQSDITEFLPITGSILIRYSAQQSFDSGEQFVRIEGFGQVIIRPGSQASNLVARLAARSQHRIGTP